LLEGAVAKRKGGGGHQIMMLLRMARKKKSAFPTPPGKGREVQVSFRGGEEGRTHRGVCVLAINAKGKKGVRGLPAPVMGKGGYAHPGRRRAPPNS